MTPTMHALFDADLMGIDPATLTVHFKPGIELGELFEGRKITPLVYDLDLERLAVRWAGYRAWLMNNDGLQPGCVKTRQ